MPHVILPKHIEPRPPDLDPDPLEINLRFKRVLDHSIKLLNLYSDKIKAQSDYLELLKEELNETFSIATARGWKSSRIEQGEAARRRILAIDQKINEEAKQNTSR